MSERKVLNKYYPPDYDPSKIPRGKRNRNATFNIRIMAPFNMRCNTCKDYIYKGKKFNSRKEDVSNEYFLGLRIYRFYIKCPRCVSEIAFKTDLETTDYTLEAGATRLFEAEKIAHQMAAEEQKQKDEDELNPMKVLENRTKQSRQEMDQIDSLEELREMNSRKNVVNTDEMIEKYRRYEEMLQKLQMEQEEQEIRSIFGGEGEQVVKRLHDSDEDTDEPASKKPTTKLDKPTDILAQDSVQVTSPKKPKAWERSVGSLSSKQSLKGLVVKKKTTLPTCTVSATVSSDTTQSVEYKVDKNITDIVIDKDSTNNVATKEPPRKETIRESNRSSTGEKGNNTQHDVATCGETEHTAKVESKPESVTNSSKPGALGGLGLLGAYSDSDSDASS